MIVATHRNNFIKFLDRNYCITAHLAERLDELKESPLFANLQKVIAATIILLEIQLTQTDHLFELLGTTNSLADNEALIAFMESVFSLIPNQQNGMQCLGLLGYIAVSDCLMQESAALAGHSLVHLSDVNLPEHQLYHSHTLEALKAALMETGIPA